MKKERVRIGNDIQAQGQKWGGREMNFLRQDCKCPHCSGNAVEDGTSAIGSPPYLSDARPSSVGRTFLASWKLEAVRAASVGCRSFLVCQNHRRAPARSACLVP